jgi:hypothetical protein
VPPPLNYSYYHGHAFSWNGVRRVLVLPLANETNYSHAAEEVRNAFCTEMQQLGRIDCVPAPPDACAVLSQTIRSNGTFNELVLIDLARTYHADAIIMGTLTQYSPYNPVRMGLNLQVVSPGDGVVVASVAGIWDSASPWIAQRARDYYAQYCRRRDEPLTANLVLDSPRLYQRFVCFEAAHILVDDIHGPPGIGVPADSGQTATAPGCGPGQPMALPPGTPTNAGQPVPLPPGAPNNPSLLPAPLRDPGR